MGMQTRSCYGFSSIFSSFTCTVLDGAENESESVEQTEVDRHESLVHALLGVRGTLCMSTRTSQPQIISEATFHHRLFTAGCVCRLDGTRKLRADLSFFPFLSRTYMELSVNANFEPQTQYGKFRSRLR